MRRTVDINIEAYNISNMKEEVVENSSIEFIAVADSVDFGNPVLQDVEYLGKGRLYVTFDRGLRVSDLSSKQITVYDIANPDELIIFMQLSIYLTKTL